MSASTVSITANTASRRRPVVVGERKSTTDLATDGGSGGLMMNGGDDKIASASRDLSYSLRGEAVVERSKEAVTVKKTVPSSTVSPRRARKVSQKREKPRWFTVIRVITKNFLLLMVIIGLVQMIRKLVANSGNVSVVPEDVSEYESRIAEVEAFVETATKMMQVQVDVVDRKIESEVGGLRRELHKKIDEKGSALEGELQKMVMRTELLERISCELRARDMFTKEDFDKFYNELKKAEKSKPGNEELSLDDVRAVARDIVEKEIERHAADGLGKVDYAVASGGAFVVRHSEPFISGKGSLWRSMTAARSEVHVDAVRMLKPSFGEPGQCCPLKGSTGFVEIRLRTAIVPEAITVEHLAKAVAYDLSTAPKDCRVFGWLHGSDAVDHSHRRILLTEFAYDVEKSHAQTFDVLESVGSNVIDTVRLELASNHGNPLFTCIYRLRVHGYEPKSNAARI
ncbi:SUN domain [Dillenia turbinata]|uniref:SUN domain n=1 Tax=Dillenia turbinata TaxID=194707 RepID=A0AAN8VHQ9_9MAGN